jgi:hypothetical protein
LLTSELRMKAQLEGKEIKFIEATIERQCDREFLIPLKKKLPNVTPFNLWPASRVQFYG